MNNSIRFLCTLVFLAAGSYAVFAQQYDPRAGVPQHYTKDATVAFTQQAYVDGYGDGGSIADEVSAILAARRKSVALAQAEARRQNNDSFFKTVTQNMNEWERYFASAKPEDLQNWYVYGYYRGRQDRRGNRGNRAINLPAEIEQAAAALEKQENLEWEKREQEAQREKWKEESTHIVNEAVRLRKTPSTSGEAIATLKANQTVRFLQKGRYDTIDGITAAWMQVETESGETGWCFDAYLDEKPPDPNALGSSSNPMDYR